MLESVAEEERDRMPLISSSSVVCQQKPKRTKPVNHRNHCRHKTKNSTGQRSFRQPAVSLRSRGILPRGAVTTPPSITVEPSARKTKQFRKTAFRRIRTESTQGTTTDESLVGKVTENDRRKHKTRGATATDSSIPTSHAQQPVPCRKEANQSKRFPRCLFRTTQSSVVPPDNEAIEVVAMLDGMPQPPETATPKRGSRLNLGSLVGSSQVLGFFGTTPAAFPHLLTYSYSTDSEESSSSSNDSNLEVALATARIFRRLQIDDSTGQIYSRSKRATQEAKAPYKALPSRQATAIENAGHYPASKELQFVMLVDEFDNFEGLLRSHRASLSSRRKLGRRRFKKVDREDRRAVGARIFS